MNIYPMLLVAIVITMLFSTIDKKRFVIDDSDFESQFNSMPQSVIYIDSFEEDEINRNTTKYVPITVNLAVYKPLVIHDDIDTLRALDSKYFSFDENINFAETDSKSKALAKVDYWQTVHSIESKQGKQLYRPKNKSKNCTWTTSPCGHHQLTVQALKDIGCKSLQCRKDRLDYDKSLKMSKKLLALNEKRLKKNGISTKDDYQKYLIHQQGATGIKTILAASKGKKLLSKKITKNMANNSPYSYRQLRKMGSKTASKKFMNHWQHKWEDEKKLVAGIKPVPNNDFVEPLVIPTFSDYEIQLALNYRF